VSHQQIAKLERQLAKLTSLPKKTVKAAAKPVAKPSSTVDLAQIERLKVIRDRNRAAMEVERAAAEKARQERAGAKLHALVVEINDLERELIDVQERMKQ